MSRYFQGCDSYGLFTQIDFKHVSELGRLNKMGMNEPLEFSFQETTSIFVQCKASLAQSSFNLISIK